MRRILIMAAALTLGGCTNETASWTIFGLQTLSDIDAGTPPTDPAAPDLAPLCLDRRHDVLYRSPCRDSDKLASREEINARVRR